MESKSLDRLRELRGLAVPALSALVASFAIGLLARRVVATEPPDFGTLLVGCTAGRLAGAPWTGGLGAVLLTLGIGGLAVSPARRRLTVIVAATCGPLVFASVEGWMSLSAVTLQVASLLAFAHSMRRSSWGLGVAATWVWPPALLVVVALLVGEIDRARHAGRSWVEACLSPAMAAAFGLAAALPAVVVRADAYLPVLPERGLDGIARTAVLWIEAWPDEATLASLLVPTSIAWANGLWLVLVGLVITLGAVSVLRRARHHEGYAALRLMMGLAMWTLILTGALGLGRGSWGSTQAMLHVVTVVLLVEGSVELGGRRRGVAAVVAFILAVGWSAGLYHVAQQWAASSPFL